MREMIRWGGLCSLLLWTLSFLVLLYAQPGRSSGAATLVMKGEITATHVSRDGEYVVFTDWKNGELYLRDLTSSADRQLTHKRPTEAGQASGDAFISPDNRMIAYTWTTPSDREVRMLPISGGEPRRVPAGGVVNWPQGWSPNGKELLVLQAISLEKVGKLGLLNTDTGEFRRISEARGAAHARLSPDGSQIVLSELSEKDPTQSDIKLIDCATGSARVLLAGSDDDYSPDWSPDGKSIFFISDRGGRPRLWSLRLADGAALPEPLFDLVDGNLAIVGVTRNLNVVVGADDIGGTDSYVGNVVWASGRVSGVQLLPNPMYRGSRRPVPSPDGSQVAFLRRGRGYRVRPGWQIPVVQQLDGPKAGQQRVYSTALTLRDAPAWYPHKGALLFTMPPEGAVGDSAGREWRFVRLDLATGRYQEVGRTGMEGFVRLAGLTDRSLYYLLDSKRVMAFDLKSRTSREIFRVAGSAEVVTDAAVLGEGERIALAVIGRGKSAAISVVTPGGGNIAELERVEANMRPQLVWCADRKSVLVSGRIAGRQGIWRIAVDGGDRQRLSLEETDITEVRLSENGARIAFTRRVARPREIWAYDGRGVSTTGTHLKR